MLSPLACLRVGNFGIIKIPLAKSDRRRVRVFDLSLLKRQYSNFSLQQVFILTKSSWLLFDVVCDVLNVFNETVDGVFVVCFCEDIKQLDSLQKADVGDESFIKAQYISSYFFLQESNIIKALNILSDRQDYLITRLLHGAIAHEDKNFAITQLLYAFKSTEGRYLEGKRTFEVQYDKPGCIFDMFRVLLKLKDALFYPLHRMACLDPLYVIEKNKKFTSHHGTPIYFKNLRWHSEQVDLYATAKVDGYVDIDIEDVEKYNLPTKIETYTCRKFHVIKNAVTEVTKLYISCDSSVINDLDYFEWLKVDEGGIYLDFSMFPLMCQYMSQSLITGPQLYQIVKVLVGLKKRYYSLIYIKNKLYSKNVDTYKQLYKSFSDNQKNVLAEKYNLTENGYQFIENPIRRGIHEISFYISDRQGENELSKIAFLAGEPLTTQNFKQTDLRETIAYLDTFCFEFFDYLNKNPSSTLESEIDLCLEQLVDYEFQIQLFRLVCVTNNNLSGILRSDIRGYKCEKGDLVFTRESLYA